MITENKPIQNTNTERQSVDVVHITKSGQQYVDRNIILNGQQVIRGGRGSNQYARKDPNQQFYNQTQVNKPPYIRQKRQSRAMYKLKAMFTYGLMFAYAFVIGITSAARDVLKTFATGVFLIANNNAPETIKEGFSLFLYGVGSFLLLIPVGILFGIAMSYSRLGKEGLPQTNMRKNRRRY